MSERQEGWYHLKTGAGWECAEWDGKQWYITGSVYPYADSDFEEIGPRIPVPDEPWQTVPVEPTESMLKAAAESDGEPDQEGCKAACFAWDYHLALAAAPTPGDDS